MTHSVHRIAVILILCLMVSGGAVAQDRDCTRGVPSPVLDSTAVSDHRFVAWADSAAEARRLSWRPRAVERGQLPNGKRLEVHHVGCVHYGLRWRFEVENASKESSAVDVTDVRRAAAWMRRVADVSAGRGQTEQKIANALQALAEAKSRWDGLPHELRGLDGYRVGLEREEDALVVTLDVVL